MVSEEIIKQEINNYEKYHKKGSTDVKNYYPDKKVFAEYARFSKGLDNLYKKGMSFSNLRPYTQGVIEGIAD